MTYNANTLASNQAIVKLDLGSDPNELTVYSSAQTHLVGDIVGYFINPEPTTLACYEDQSSTTMAGNSGASLDSPACMAGYSYAGGGCAATLSSGRVVVSRPSSGIHYCFLQNQDSSSQTVYAYINCCRVPGRW
jgi:hypothetical protein